MPYPEAIRRETGCKVGWLYYDNEADALEASKAARHNGLIDRDLGYDFGYCSPGSVTKTDNGEWEVCVS